MLCNCQIYRSTHGFCDPCRTSRCCSWATFLLCPIKRAVAQGLFLKTGLLKCMLLNGCQRMQAMSDRCWIIMRSYSSNIQLAARKHAHANII